MSLSPFSSFLSYSYVGKLSVTLGGIIMLKSAFCRSQICGESNTFCAFCVRLPLPLPNTSSFTQQHKHKRCRHRRCRCHCRRPAAKLPPTAEAVALPPPPQSPRVHLFGSLNFLWKSSINFNFFQLFGIAFIRRGNATLFN